MAIFRRCPRCGKLFSGRECNKCAAARNKKRAERDESLRVYKKVRWQKCRRDARLKWMDFDIWVLGLGRWVRIPSHVVVHHIYEREERPDLCYDLDNLITVSLDSHNEIHQMYETDRAAAIARIRKGMDIFKEMLSNDS